MPLVRWLWRAYLRTAVVPLLAIEFSFLLVYWIGNSAIYERNVETVEAISTDFLMRTAQREAMSIGETLAGISRLTQVFAAQTRLALETPFAPPDEETARYAFSPEGVYHTTRDIGTTATFYSGIMPIGPAEIEKVRSTARLDPLMKDIKDSSPLITQIYFNTFDSYNRIYPYFDVLTRYAARMDIPTFNFYYEADQKHNPARKPVWTDAYIDPAGSGWMVSSIAPVYHGDFLEAVAGIDVTIETFVNKLLDLDLPWNSYALLVGRDGTILALPPRGEADWSLREKTSHHYADAIKSEVFKPDDFNILKRPDSHVLATTLTAMENGLVEFELNGAKMAAWARIPGPDWSLILIAPHDSILADANDLRDKLSTVGYAMIALLLIFYAGFFIVLYGRARAMSRQVAQPIKELEALTSLIGDGAYEQPEPHFAVGELNTLGHRLVDMGRRLGVAYARIVEAEQAVRLSLDKERRVNEQQRQFINVVSHEFRTPLAIIDGVAQRMERRPERMVGKRLADSAHSLRTAVQRATDVVDNALSLGWLEKGLPSQPMVSCDFRRITADVCTTIGLAFPGHAFALSLDGLPAALTCDPALMRHVLMVVVDNAARYSPTGSVVRIEGRQVEGDGETGGLVVLSVTDQGCGIPPQDMSRLFERFTRGSEAMRSHGVGVGLYLARQLLNTHGGTIRVDSTPGRGTTVTVHLPIAGLRRDKTLNQPEAS